MVIDNHLDLIVFMRHSSGAYCLLAIFITLLAFILATEPGKGLASDTEH